MLIAFLMLFTAGCVAHHQQIHGNNPAFYLKKTDARQVFLVTDLDDFKPRKALLIDGQWVVVVPADRTFRYYYLVDGKVFLPPCKMKENDDFGSENCIFDPGE
ncbi:MAG: hypothetical protein WC836_24020 [Desulfobacula sp.]